ncbi:MAG: methyltransferase, FkbM family [Myxococcaceae bacterium]|nr:methyltransferase, FkbM family [Myxococcaceae bacterium]
MEKVRSGDVAWDIGANVGLYTERLSDAVGPTGRVVAFEPFPSCYAELQRRTAGRSNVQALMTALSNQKGMAPMTAGSDPLSPTNSLFAQPGTASIDVPVSPAHELVASGSVPAPNVVKIDVEGFEEEVLEGFGDLLSEPSLRAVLIEVHFSILDQRNRRQAPARISSLLTHHGFGLRWIDASHLEAVRS